MPVLITPEKSDFRKVAFLNLFGERPGTHVRTGAKRVSGCESSGFLQQA